MKKFLKYIDKKKSKLYNMFGLLILIFSFINFSSAGSLTITGTVNLTNPTLYAGTYFGYFSFPYPYKPMDIDCTFSNFNGTVPSTTNTRLSFFGVSSSTYGTISSSTLCTFNSSAFNNGSFSCSHRSSNSNKGVYLGFNFGMTHNSSFSFDYSCVFSGEYLSLGSSDCSSFESQLSTCQSDLATATGNISSLTSSLSSCQSDLATATGNVSSLTSSLSSCQSDLATATGNISSLSGSLAICQSDLTTCQNSSSSSCDYSEYESTISSLSGSLASCTTNYNSCTSELNSCLSNSGSCSGTGVQWSSLWINNIQHLGASSIFITIPEEINWSYTNENDEFDLDVVGYNVDTEYIEGIINIQTNKPDKVDLNNIITGLIPLFVPGFVIILFIYFAFRLIKKIF